MFRREIPKSYKETWKTFNDYPTWLVGVKLQANGRGKISFLAIRITYSLCLYESIRGLLTRRVRLL